MEKERLLATEKAILRDKLACGESLGATVSNLGQAGFKNTVDASRIGRYRPPENRICIIAEKGFIDECFEKKLELPCFLEAGPREFLYFDPATVRIGIVTTGGIAPGLNTVIHSIVNMHCNVYGMRRKAYGFLNGFRGVAQERYMDLDPGVTREWIHKGGTGLIAGRGKQDISKMVTSLERLGINILYVIGGDGSLTAAHLIAQEVKRRDKKIVVAGIPKTMDNDILWVWHSFGFDTAVEEATRFINAIHDEAKSTGRIALMSLFGRDAGFVAAHAALGSGQVDIVLVPEVAFKIEPLLAYVENVVQDKGYAVIVLAEGAGPQGYTEDSVRKELAQQELDPTDRSNPRVAEAIRAWKLHSLQTRFEAHFRDFREGQHGVFVQEPRYLIRAIPANSVDQIYCQRLADLAVHNALAGFTDFMISQWLTEYVLVPLDLVAYGHKKIPPSGIFWTTVISSTGQPSFD